MCSKTCSAIIAGTVILISHDRDFLDRVVSAVIVPEGEGRWAEYAGGYSDMLTQRGDDIVRKSGRPKSLSSPKKSPAASKQDKRRLSFNDKHALDTLPKRIAALQADIAKLQKKLDDPGLYARDRAEFSRVSEAVGRRRMNSLRRKKNGWSWKFCARNWSGSSVMSLPGLTRQSISIANFFEMDTRVACV